MPTRNNTAVRVHLQGYKMASAGMRTLQSELLSREGGATLHGVVRKFREDVIDRVVSPSWALTRKYCLVNWGVPNHILQNPPRKPGYFILNNYGTAIASNKLHFFQHYSDLDLPLPWHTNNQEDAQERVNSSSRAPNNPVIVERHILKGHSGNGIRMVYPGQQVNRAPLYTSYELKRDEYRVHFFRHPGEPTQYFIQQKRMRREAEREAEEEANPTRFKVRNHVNGWVFCHLNVNNNQVVTEAAAEFAMSTSLDFGAVDIIYNHSQRHAYILEVNTAPGIEGETGRWYARQITTACKNHDFTSTTGAYS